MKRTLTLNANKNNKNMSLRKFINATIRYYGTATEVAERTGMPKSTVSQISNGIRDSISSKTLKDIKDGLNVDINAALNGELKFLRGRNRKKALSKDDCLLFLHQQKINRDELIEIITLLKEKVLELELDLEMEPETGEKHEIV